MSSHIDTQSIENADLREVWSVAEFSRRFRLDEREEDRLLKLFGHFATKQELLANVQRPCRFR